ncbi:MAG: response regulator [Phycisphaeraceae bacterium]|nr:response regulator [Phycisphaeraceae bacterium]
MIRDGTNDLASGRAPGRAVWAIALAAVAMGAVTLISLSLTLLAADQSRSRLDQLRERNARLVQNAGRELAAARQACAIIAADQQVSRMEGIEPLTGAWWTTTGDRAIDRALSDLGARVGRLRVAVGAARTAGLELAAAASSADEAGDRVLAAQGALAADVQRLEGRKRLTWLKRLHEFDDAGAADVGTSARAAVEALKEAAPVAAVQRELAELEALRLRVLGAASADSLADLSENRLWPGLDRLFEMVADLAEADSALAEMIEPVRVAWLGGDGAPGLLDRARSLLVSREARDAALRSLLERIDEVAVANLALAERTAEEGTRVAGEIRASGAWAWNVVAATKAAGLLLVVVLAARIARAMQRQFRQTVEARTRAEAHAAALAEAKADLEARARQLEIARSQAEASSRAKSAFLANMSHEIRTPMTAILGYADVLGERGLSERDRRGAVETIRRNGVHLLAVISDILDVSKIEAGKLAVESADVSLMELVRDVVDLMKVRAEEKGLRLGISLDTPVPETVRTDPTRMRQVLLNLVSNAIKFTERGSVGVHLGILRAGRPLLQVRVTDTGVGMTPEQVGILFRPFVQGDISLTRRHGGTGLGLAISKRLTVMLGGDITVSSVPGRGSEFAATFDPGALEGVRLIQPEAAALPAATRGTGGRTDGPGRLAGVRVLLVEDGPDNQRLLAHVLIRAGATVVVADNGRDGVERAFHAEARAEPFDAVLMDMQMPTMDGYEASGRLRAAGFARPIIALTAHAMAGDREKCLAAGCTEYLTKPIAPSVLVDAVARVCAEARERAERPAA